MGAKESMVLNLIDLDYHGAHVNDKQDGERVRPVIRELGHKFLHFLPIVGPMLLRKREFQYKLDPETDIVSLGKDSNGVEYKAVVPASDVPRLNEDVTPFARLRKHFEELQTDQSEKIEELERELGKKRKKIRQLQEEQAEQEKRESSQPQRRHTCPMCNEDYPVSTWRANDGECSSCGTVIDQFKGDGDG